MYVDAAYCYRQNRAICQSVTLVSPAKTAAPIEMPFGLRTWVGLGNHVLDEGPDPPWEGAILRGKGRPIVQYRDTAVPCAKTAEPTEMPFGLWAWMGPRNHVLDGGPAVLRDVAMETNFGTQFAIIGFVGYNFGCMIASDMLFDSRGWVFGVKLSDEDIADFEVRRHVVTSTTLAFYIWGAHWRHLANMTEPSICGGDAALCQIILITCCYFIAGAQ